MADLRQQVAAFMQEHVYPAEHVLEAHAADPKTKWTVHPLMEQMKVRHSSVAGFLGTQGSSICSKVRHRCNQRPCTALSCTILNHL